MDNVSRLRLISSANYSSPPEEDKEEIAVKSPKTSFWFTLAGSWHIPLNRTARQQAHNVDHSQAMPLSDGHHILFTDNETGLLCLGSDRPVGNLQPLSRKFVFEPPKELLISNSAQTPTVYAATQGLSNGVRIVAGYGSEIVLYSVPIDAFKYSAAEQEGTLQDSSKPFEELEWLDVLLHPPSNAHAIRETMSESSNAVPSERLNMLWTHYLPASEKYKTESLDRLWPLKIPGTSIGHLDGLKALSVQETVMDGLVVWAFSNSGLAKAWEMDNGQGPIVQLHSEVRADGVIRETEKPSVQDTECLC